MTRLELVINTDGTARAIYSDALAPLLASLGPSAEVTRASHVEPCLGGWGADLSPVGGPVLGPFSLRAEALAAEVEWLREHVLGVAS